MQDEGDDYWTERPAAPSGDAPALRVETLEASGLERRCLFQGATFVALGAVAPWIVRPEPDHAVTRTLFTRGDAPWHLWDREPGIYLRSPALLETLRHHVRKFTRVQDDTGKRFYWRFREARPLGLYRRRLAVLDLARICDRDHRKPGAGPMRFALRACAT